MKINVVVFARVKEIVGFDHVELDLDEGATVGELKKTLTQKYPEIDSFLNHCSIAVDHEYSTDQTALTEKCEVGIIPPVSGG